jgi:uncharacterized repeat protein (TIGR03847 family)
MGIEDLGPAERIVAGAIGEPGSRRFYLQVTADGEVTTMLAEKAQINALATQGVAVLDASEISSDEVAVDRLVAAGMYVEDPGLDGERFRIGEISIALAPSELLTITVEDIEGEDGITFVIAPEQFRAMAKVAIDVVESGRPTCPWCKLPMDPAGHQCAARNGHHQD